MSPIRFRSIAGSNECKNIWELSLTTFRSNPWINECKKVLEVKVATMAARPNEQWHPASRMWR